jgi:hypothetical protein
VEIRLALEADLTAAGIGLGAELIACVGRAAADAGLDAGDIVMRTKRSLDRVAVGECVCRTSCALGRNVAGRWSWSPAVLRLLQLDALDGGPLADRARVA